jgi:hypothetical protein
MNVKNNVLKDVPKEIWKKYTSTCTYTALLKIVIKLI